MGGRSLEPVGVPPVIPKFIVAAMLVFTAVVSRAGVDERRAKSEVVISISYFPDRLDPAAISNYQHFLLLQTSFDTLIRVNAARRPVGSLARRWQVSPDGRTYRVELRPGCRFHDGSTVTAGDVAYSFARHFWPASQSAVASQLRGKLVGAEGLGQGAIPSGIRAEGDRIVVFELKAPYAPFLSVLSMPGYSVISRAAALRGQIVGSGPYIPRFIAGKKEWRLERYPDYFDDAPKTRAYTVLAEPDYSRMIAGIVSGDVDVAIGAPPAVAFASAMPEKVRLIRSNSIVFLHFFLLPRNHLTGNVDFRRDLAGLFYLVFTQEKFRNPTQEFAPSLIPPGIMPRSYYRRRMPRVTVQEFARRWADDAKGVRLRMMIRETYFSKAAMEEMRRVFARAGLTVDFDALTPENFQGHLDRRDYDLFSMPYMSNFADPDGFLDYVHPGRLFPGDFPPALRLFEELSHIRAEANDKVRLDRYSTSLREFEDGWYVIPLLSVNLPILSASGVHIPDTSYRFEAEWRDIYWEKP